LEEGRLLKELMSYIDYPMVKVPGGEIELRDDRIKSKWNAEIRPFLLGRYLVTTDFYYTITNESPNMMPFLFVIYFHKKLDWESLILSIVKILFVIGNQTVFEFQQKQSGNMHVKPGLLVIGTES
jgi:hypothetical protein